jgi:hypothetical protein
MTNEELADLIRARTDNLREWFAGELTVRDDRQDAGFAVVAEALGDFRQHLDQRLGDTADDLRGGFDAKLTALQSSLLVIQGDILRMRADLLKLRETVEAHARALEGRP